ncbi:NADP(H)-dependent aldo-keto reductase [Spiribacter sp. 2438]|uniref:NADP(H)-dependent aldo-keto reductase n=1 Tax=Spiribacter sp. 2438 TaxID=2666185 RepID=UPI0012B102CE|nr:NADP(H)-dependent aldo-keto reductase [Spiribacter sp. 2438]QGM21953.1 NADP(H)-dependent aldo-keto reductase [Spiribacter sp. 2438]
MEYRQLGPTDLNVSALCLGTMTWGKQNTQDEAFAQLDYALERGINFIDTAEMYPVPPESETQGATETMIGNWLAARDNRDRVILATKIAGPGLGTVRDGKTDYGSKDIRAAVEASLQRLQTEVIDLYQLHWPARQSNFFGKLGFQVDASEPDPMPGMLAALEALQRMVDEGKIRYVGLSNESAWGTMKFLELAERHGLPRVVSVQNPYNLLNRSYEIGLAEVSHREQVGLLPYSPLAFGVLSGKYLGGERPAGARLTLFERFTRYTKGPGLEATEAYVNLAREHGLDPSQMALAWVTEQPFVASNIIGATTLEQLKTNIDSIDVRLDEDLLKGIEAIHADRPNPCP